VLLAQVELPAEVLLERAEAVLFTEVSNNSSVGVIGEAFSTAAISSGLLAHFKKQY